MPERMSSLLLNGSSAAFSMSSVNAVPVCFGKNSISRLVPLGV
jgi:hypothetical protein